MGQGGAQCTLKIALFLPLMHFKCIRAEMQKEMSGLDLLALMHRLRGTAFKGENPCKKTKENFSMVKGNLNKMPFWKEFKKIIFLLCFCLSSSGL